LDRKEMRTWLAAATARLGVGVGVATTIATGDVSRRHWAVSGMGFRGRHSRSL
jgi:hypothetical protein